MAQYIDKSALVAMIKKLNGKVNDGSSYCNGWQHALRMLEMELDTLEVKEVDLEEECKTYLKNNFTSKEAPDEFLTTLMQLDDMVLFAKHFYEFGLKAQKGGISYEHFNFPRRA